MLQKQVKVFFFSNGTPQYIIEIEIPLNRYIIFLSLISQVSEIIALFYKIWIFFIFTLGSYAAKFIHLHC